MNDDNTIAVSVIIVSFVVLAIALVTLTRGCVEDSVGSKTCDPYQSFGIVDGYAVCKTPEGPTVKER